MNGVWKTNTSRDFLKPGKKSWHILYRPKHTRNINICGKQWQMILLLFLLLCHLIIFLIFIRCRVLLDLLYILNQATLIVSILEVQSSLSLNTRPLVGFLVLTNFLKLKQFWWYLHVLYKLNDTFRLSLNTIEFHGFFFFSLKCEIWLFFTPSFSVK